MKKFTGSIAGRVLMGVLAVSALVTVAFVSPRLVSAATMPTNSGITKALTHVTNEDAVEHLTGQASDMESNEVETPTITDADSTGDSKAVNGQVNENSDESMNSMETSQATSQAESSMNSADASQGIGQTLSQTIRTDIVETLASHGIDISIPNAHSDR